jgi:hypothetical protein
MSEEYEWQKSSFCADATCVEVGMGAQQIALRDGKSPAQPHLVFTPDAWQDFLELVVEDMRFSNNG